MLREKAVQLRKAGYSYNMITEKIGVSKSTLSYWLRDIPYHPNAETMNRTWKGNRKAGLERSKEKIVNLKIAREDAKKELGKITKRDLMMLGIGLYIGEGSKSIESIRITNSDAAVIVLAMKWFREVCAMDDENFSLILFLYPDTNEDEAKKHWSSVTKLPPKCFKKSQVDRRNGKSRINHGKLPFGTLQIRIKASGDSKKGVYLFRKIEEWSRLVSQ